jgi:hypothetical protein
MAKGQSGPAPKRPRSAYILFTMEKREAVKSANPGIANKEILKKLGGQWKVLSDKEKQVYTDRAAKEKEAYDAQKPSAGKKGKKEKKAAKKAADSSNGSDDES